MATSTDVVVIGGGYAGVMAANRLTRGDGVTVTLINPRPAFVERIRLHQLVGGSDDAVVDYREVPGAAEFAHPIATLEDARRLRPALDAVPATAAVTVVGAGPTGIETAAELGGVTVLDGAGTTVTAVTRAAVRLDGGGELPSEVTVWTAGFGVPDLAARSGLSTDALGRLRTDETLTSVDGPHIVAAGDSAAPSDLPLRMSCQAAMPLGARAADTVLSRIAGERPETLNQVFAGQCLGLGRRGDLFQFAHRHDVALWLHVDGRLGARIKEFVRRGIVEHLADEAHRPGSYRLHRVPGNSKRGELLRGVSTRRTRCPR
ncbi:NAD(P)/FAD-dependent oxidoreductase [Saccharothrix stipae]